MSETREELEKEKLKAEIKKINFDIENSILLKRIEAFKSSMTAMSLVSIFVYVAHKETKNHHSLIFILSDSWILLIVIVTIFSFALACTEKELSSAIAYVREMWSYLKKPPVCILLIFFWYNIFVIKRGLFHIS